MREALAILAGPVRSFLFGYGSASIVGALRLPARPGSGLLCKPIALGAALAGFVAVYHGARLVLRHACVRASEWRRAAVAGGLAGWVLAFKAPDIAGLHTELHAGVTIAAIRSLVCAAFDRPAGSRALLSRRGRRGAVAAASVVVAGTASWYLLSTHWSRPSSLPQSVRAWFASMLRPPPLPSSQLPSPHLSAPPPPAAGHSSPVVAFARGWSRGARVHFLVSGPSALLLHCVERSGGAVTRTNAASPPPAGRRLLRRTRGLVIESAAAGLLPATFCALLHKGPVACSSAGWVAGVAVAPLSAGLRLDVSLRLAYQALLSYAHAVYHCWGGGGGPLLPPLDGVSASAGAEAAVGRLLGSTIFGGGAAVLLAEYARTAGGELRAEAGGMGLGLGSRTCRAIHFLLGFDDASFGRTRVARRRRPPP